MSDKQPSGWAIGWTAFAGIIMILMGIWWIIGGFSAILNPNFFVVTETWILQLDVSTWGWIHLILGVVILASGFGLFSGAGWARVVGVIVAILAALAAFSWLPYYPVWGIIYIVAAVGVIWALTVHGHDITEAATA